MFNSSYRAVVLIALGMCVWLTGCEDPQALQERKRQLIEQGIPPQRLAPTGFGEFHPLDAGDSDEAYRKNRRIELKFTQR